MRELLLEQLARRGEARDRARSITGEQLHKWRELRDYWLEHPAGYPPVDLGVHAAVVSIVAAPITARIFRKYAPFLGMIQRLHDRFAVLAK